MWLLGFIVAVFLNTGVHATLLGRSNFNIIKVLSTFSTLTVLVKNFGTICLSYMIFAIGRSLWVMGSLNRPFPSNFQVAPNLCFKARLSARPLI